MTFLWFALNLVVAPQLLAQEIKIEVVSIKPVPANERTFFTSGKTIHSSCTLAGQIQWAYQTTDYRLTKLPSWVDQQGYDITAKADRDTALSEGQFRQLLRAVLADRFQLKTHRVTEDVAVYALVIDTAGPKLDKSAPGVVRAEKRLTGHLESTRNDVDFLAHRLEQELDHRVINLTGLTGFYDWKLEWTPDQGALASAADSSGPSIFTAVKKQLGLRLELRKKYPLEILVIDQAEKPEPN